MFVIGVMTIISGLTNTHGMLLQSIPVLLSVIVTAIVTSALLERQTFGEERREKSVQIHTSKLSAYSEFISKMWGTLSGEIIDQNKIEVLRAEMFNKLIFYFDNRVIGLILLKLKELREDLDRIELNNEDNGDDKKAARYRKIFAEITAILRNDITPHDDSSDLGTDAMHIRQLWGAIDSFINDGNLRTVRLGDSATLQENNGQEPFKNRCFHFNAWGWEYQKLLWSEVTGQLYPLFMCEYGESWRTDILKNRIRANDLIFLYRAGECGYIGISRAKGYVTVEFGSGENEMECSVHSYETGKTQIIDNEHLKKESPEYARKLIDLYKQYRAERATTDDGTAYYSYLYVEPILLHAAGVGSADINNRTIAPLDAGSARSIFAKFKKLADDNRIAAGHIDRELFDRIAAENGFTD